jgi:hypothetical protein
MLGPLRQMALDRVGARGAERLRVGRMQGVPVFGERVEQEHAALFGCVGRKDIAAAVKKALL